MCYIKHDFMQIKGLAGFVIPARPFAVIAP